MRRTLPLATLTLAFVLAIPAGAEPIGFLASTKGDVEHAPGGGATWQAAQRDAEVEIGDGFRTGPDSQAKIVLVDDTLFQIDEETELRIETWHVGAAATREKSLVRQLRGRLRTTVGDAFGGSTRIELHVPTAAIGIKGTDFETRKRDFWEACTISGGIDVSNPYGSASPPPGMCVRAYPDRAPSEPFPNPLPPLDVNGDDEGGKRGVATRDFKEKIDVDVAAEGGSPPPPGGGGNGGSSYDGSSIDNNEDELLPDVDVPEPALPDPPVDILQ